MSEMRLNLQSRRSRHARLARRMKHGGYTALRVISAGSALGGIYLLITNNDYGYAALGLALFAGMWIIWFKSYLQTIPAKKSGQSVDDLLDADLLAKLKPPVTAQSVWAAVTDHWQEIFLTNHLVINPKIVEQVLSDNENDTEAIWQLARKLQAPHDPTSLSVGSVTAALLLSSKELTEHLVTQRIKPQDTMHVHSWLSRIIEYQKVSKPYFGGIGRDWAFGFTPNLERFSTNISQQVQNGGGHSHFLSRSNAIDTMIHNLSHAGSIAVVGPSGIGKTSAVYALAERLFDKSASADLKDHQIVALNASMILSSGKQQLERLMLTLFGEAIQSGNMILFLDEAHLFFREGVGSFDLSQILLPVLQNRRLKLICAFDATDYQRLKSTQPALVANLTPVMLPEPPADDVMKIIEDAALGIEHRSKSIVTFDAIREAHRLSGQYIQDMAYPGKAIQLLDQAAGFAEQDIITARSVQQAIESTLGVKAGGAEADEADALLHLEDRIHERMINQTRAVSVVSNALRRSRAGVSNQSRPIGSFLFLGPTGVGKTELAKSLAATYFGDVKNMIRLDMSEYQQPQDASRLLASGAESQSLLLAIRKQPFSVVLLDEIEKAHPNVLNLLLQMLDEGQLTDDTGQQTNFKNAIIIVTSNAGAQDIIARIQQNQPLEEFERPLVDKLIAEGVFKPELINRFDEVVLFRPLTQDELGQVAGLMLKEVNRNLEHQNISVKLTPAALAKLVEQGYDPQFGSRPMRRVIQRTVEDTIAQRILSGQVQPGGEVLFDVSDFPTET